MAGKSARESAVSAEQTIEENIGDILPEANEPEAPAEKKEEKADVLDLSEFPSSTKNERPNESEDPDGELEKKEKDDEEASADISDDDILDIAKEDLGLKDDEPDEEEVSEESISAMPKKDREAFISMRQAIRDQKKANEEQRKRIAELEAGSLDTDEVKKLREENQSLQQQISEVALERSPAFKRKYTDKITANIKRIEDLLGEDTDKKVVQSLANADPTTRRRYIAENFSSMAGSVNYYFDRVDELRNEARAELQSASSSVEKYREMQSKESQKRMAEERGLLFRRVVGELGETNPLLKQRPGNEKWNKVATSLQGRIKEVIDSQDPAVQAKFIAQGVLAPLYYKTMLDMKQRLESAQSRSDAVTKAFPRTRRPSNSAGNKSEKRQFKSVEDIAGAALESAM